ncbi:hypothetical protein J2848_000448 [Azospirillum lipoferum]|uniref:DUF2946 domain-containing protein n=1 Tax=Azospirillum lipoferum TaxID=193 RepID=A0A5A9GS89_AZOLI|nr:MULTISPECIES: hypothetical protein [Azospirillum]KAA0597290.1 hypothetical protein FZ942_09415 [Azospirillum lipoferum]MCP1608812.1 hypothetical protein [Azospirillum lipoferum]MDW5535873.1 hypothetical protein [Azospirillum sp. NL1]
MCVVDWMRRLSGIAGALVLVMLGVLLWSGDTAAACPHDAPAAVAMHGVSHATDMDGMDHGRRHTPGRTHHAMQPCCAGMACATMVVGLPSAGLLTPAGSLGLLLRWATGPLREGLGVRPDLPPPRLG